MGFQFFRVDYTMPTNQEYWNQLSLVRLQLLPIYIPYSYTPSYLLVLVIIIYLFGSYSRKRRQNAPRVNVLNETVE